MYSLTRSENRISSRSLHLVFPLAAQPIFKLHLRVEVQSSPFFLLPSCVWSPHVGSPSLKYEKRPYTSGDEKGRIIRPNLGDMQQKSLPCDPGASLKVMRPYSWGITTPTYHHRTGGSKKHTLKENGNKNDRFKQISFEKSLSGQAAGGGVLKIHLSQSDMSILGND